MCVSCMYVYVCVSGCVRLCLSGVKTLEMYLLRKKLKAGLLTSTLIFKSASAHRIIATHHAKSKSLFTLERRED